MAQIECKKTLRWGENEDQSESFTKGKVYPLTNYIDATETNEFMATINNQGEPHLLGKWHKHFKIKK